MEKLSPTEEITRKISNDIKVKFDKETTATIAKNCDCDNVTNAIMFTVEELRQIPYNVRMFYWTVKKRIKDIDDCVDQDTFLEIIHFLRSLCDQKREHHKHGANIIICSDVNDIDCASISPGTTQFENEEHPFVKNSNFATACKLADPGTSFFVFQKMDEDPKIKCGKMRDFIQNDTIVNSMKRLCHRPNIGFSMESGSNCIRIFYDGDLCVEYFLSETTGSWTTRFKEDIKGLISISCLNENESKLLTEHVINLSYIGSGAMIIITKNSEKIKAYLSDNINLLSHNLNSNMTNMHFTGWASEDGAIIIESKQFAVIKYYGVSISPKAVVSDAYKDLFKKSTCGSRHQKAAQYACEFPEDYLVVVSENRTISFLHGETPIYWRDEYVEPFYKSENKEDD